MNGEEAWTLPHGAHRGRARHGYGWRPTGDQRLRFRVVGLSLRVEGLGVRVQGGWFRVDGLGVRG